MDDVDTDIRKCACGTTFDLEADEGYCDGENDAVCNACKAKQDEENEAEWGWMRQAVKAAKCPDCGKVPPYPGVHSEDDACYRESMRLAGRSHLVQP